MMKRKKSKDKGKRWNGGTDEEQRKFIIKSVFMDFTPPYHIGVVEKFGGRI